MKFAEATQQRDQSCRCGIHRFARDPITRVKQLVAAGRTLDQVKRERSTRPWDERLPKSFVTSDHVVEETYRAVRP